MKPLRSILISFAVVASMAACASAGRERVPAAESEYEVSQLDTVRIATANVPGDPMASIVVLPRQYFAEGDTTRYPVVYLLNGYSGNHTTWPGIRPDIDSLATVYGMIFVCPDGRDSWYWDSPKVPEMKMETFITTELIPSVDSFYRTNATREGRAVTGLSMGGQGAMWLSMRHPDLFGSAGSTSGGVDIRPFPEKWKMAKWLGAESENQKVWDEHAIVNVAKSLEPGALNLIIDCGYDDFFAEVNEDLHRILLDRKVPHDYISRPGVHNRAYWKNSLLYQLQFFNQCFQKR